MSPQVGLQRYNDARGFGDKINGMDSQGTRDIDVISHKGVDTFV